jgi:hypothetical protein
MAFETAALMKLAGAVPQPLIGSWITAGVGITTPSRQPLTLTLGNACSAGNDAAQLFGLGDPVLLIDPNGANGENCRISAVSGNTVTLGPQNDDQNWVTRYPHVAGAFATGTFISLGIDVNNVYVQTEDGNTGAWFYIGSQYNFTAAFGRISKLAKVVAGVQPYSYSASENFFGAPFRASELWVLGTAGDQWTPTLGVL